MQARGRHHFPAATAHGASLTLGARAPEPAAPRPTPATQPVAGLDPASRYQDLVVLVLLIAPGISVID
jgi:hypothetical protein